MDGEALMRVRLRGVNRVRKRQADGRVVVYYYAWKGGPRLAGQPGTPDFIASYNEAVAQKAQTPSGVLLGVLNRYQESEEFKALADSTRRGYVGLILRIEKRFADFPIKALSDHRSR